MGDVLLSSAIAIGGLMLAVWLISLPLRDVSIVDIAWGPGFAVVAWLVFVLTGERESATGGLPPSRWLLPVLSSLWAVRLATYLAWRKHGEGEDKRYAAMREKRGDSFRWRSLYVVFLLQGVLMWVISLPLQVGIARAVPGWHWQHLAGLILWTVGMVFEAGGDWQLARFRSQPHNTGDVMDRGLWKYTRHPNYFGDCCLWWGLTLIALAGLDATRWWIIVSPILLTILLLKFSGVTLLEQSLRSDRPGYADYVRRTSAFIPWPPKQELDR